MAVLILGATGRTGQLVLTEALKRGHTVTALARNPDALNSVTIPEEQRAKLTVVSGSPLQAEEIDNAVTTASQQPGRLVIISALNSRRTSENPWAAPHPTDSPPRMMADSMANVLASIAKLPSANEKPKVVHVSAAGVGDSYANSPFILRMLINYSNIGLTYKDHEEVEKELKNAGESITRVVVQPTRLEDYDETQYKVWPHDKGKFSGMSGKCSRAAVAKFTLDAAEGTEFDNKDTILLA